jgi:tetratricopeptide (TPR) repeat protein
MMNTKFNPLPTFSVGIAATLLIVAAGCGPSRPSLEELVQTDPEKVVRQQDSLLQATSDETLLVPLLVQAHLSLAKEAQEKNDWKTAQEHYAAVIQLDGSNKPARYAMALHKGQVLYKKGDRSALWDAIEQFSIAANVYPERGEPHYWVALSYLKEDEQDFELILEALDRALARDLPEDLRQIAEQKRAETLKKKETFEAFWK